LVQQVLMQVPLEQIDPGEQETPAQGSLMQVPEMQTCPDPQVTF
jgi:hypothetical protein